MTREAYGIPVPRGVRKDWEANAMLNVRKFLQQRYRIPEGWSEPTNCVFWRDRFHRLRLIVAHYSNGRSATVRIDSNGVWKTVFGEVGNG